MQIKCLFPSSDLPGTARNAWTMRRWSDAVFRKCDRRAQRFSTQVPRPTSVEIRISVVWTNVHSVRRTYRTVDRQSRTASGHRFASPTLKPIRAVVIFSVVRPVITRPMRIDTIFRFRQVIVNRRPPRVYFIEISLSFVRSLYTPFEGRGGWGK